jgi:hypothetical protein
MTYVNLEVSKLMLQGTADGKVHLIMQFQDLPNTLGFEIKSLEELNNFLKTFAYEELGSIKYMRAVLNEENKVVAFAHITKDSVFNLETLAEEAV